MFGKVKRLLRNFYIDMATQGTFVGGRVISIDGRESAYDSVNTGYDVLDFIFFKQYQIRDNDVIVDVGSGKGRVLNYLLYKGVKNKIIGYEINSLIADKTKFNLSKYDNVEIYGKNIFDDFPQNANVFYMFNPFKRTMMEDFKEHILSIKYRNPIILYYNPTCLEVFNDLRFKTELIDVPLRFFGIPYKLAVIKLT